MSGTQSIKLYESTALQALTGPALRPGGIELTRRAFSLCALPAGAMVVDIGCGTGVTVNFLRRQYRFKASGLDCSSVMLDRARKRFPGVPLIRGTASCLPFADRRVDVLVCECVLSLVEALEKAWREFYRVLAPGGLLVMSDVYARTPERAGERTSVAIACCLKGARTRGDLRKRLDQNGFNLLAWEDHSPYLKRLAAKLTFAGISFPAMKEAGACACGQEPPTGLRCAKPGYFLMVALKRGER